MHPLCIRASDHSFSFGVSCFTHHKCILRTIPMVKPWKFCHQNRPLPISFAITISWRYTFFVFSWFCYFYGVVISDTLFDLVAVLQWTDLRDQPITAFLMKGCFVDSIDIDGFNWIRITDQISQNKSGNDKRKKINKCEGKWDGGN